MPPVSLVTTTALDRAASETLGCFNDGDECGSIEWIVRRRFGMQHELSVGSSRGGPQRMLWSWIKTRKFWAIGNVLFISS